MTLQDKTKTMEMCHLGVCPIHLPAATYVNTMFICSNLAYKSTFVCGGVSYNVTKDMNLTDTIMRMIMFNIMSGNDHLHPWQLI